MIDNSSILNADTRRIPLRSLTHLQDETPIKRHNNGILATTP